MLFHIQEQSEESTTNNKMNWDLFWITLCIVVSVVVIIELRILIAVLVPKTLKKGNNEIVITKKTWIEFRLLETIKNKYSLQRKCPHRIMVLHWTWNPGPPGLPSSILGVGV